MPKRQFNFKNFIWLYEQISTYANIVISNLDNTMNNINFQNTLKQKNGQIINHSVVQ